MSSKKQIKNRPINLVPQEGLSSTTAGRVLLWVLSTFRIILIVTEVFVIGSFVSRFWLDAKNTDLSQEIKEKKAVISSLSEFETDFKDIQNRLLAYETHKKESGLILSNIENFAAYKPPGVRFNNINAKIDYIDLDAVAAVETQIQQYWLNLKESRNYENVNISSIGASKEDGGFDFLISANVKK